MSTNPKDFPRNLLISEEEYNRIRKSESVCVGLDIGTTNISATVMALNSNIQTEIYSIPNHFNIKSENAYFYEQSASLISKNAKSLLDSIISCYSKVESIGITGQMHGIVYVDFEGAPISELITWRDKRGDVTLPDGNSICEKITALTNEPIATGYGIASHYYNKIFNLVPPNAVSFCSIMDIIVLALTGRNLPLVHASVAASFGLFDAQNGCFMTDKLSLLEISEDFLPAITSDAEICGKYKNIPVAVAIGDNQASFFGSVKHHNESILVNIGTRSQISLMTNDATKRSNIEKRPLLGKYYLACGSALCGGAAYALLERFFREFTSAAYGDEKPVYEVLNNLAEAAYKNKNTALTVDTAFSGTRSNPQKRGSISYIDEHSFTPGGVALGFIKGICNELSDYYLNTETEGKKYVIASGGAVRKNKVMQMVISDTFKLPLQICNVKEEASVGTALFSALSTGMLKNINDFSRFISY